MNALAPPDLAEGELRAARLRAPLLSELRRPQRAAARRPAPALAVAILALAIALTALGLSRGSEPALAVEQQDGWLVLRIADLSAGEAALTRDLRDAGIRGEVRLLPVEADEAGRWAIISEHPRAPDGAAAPGTVPAIGDRAGETTPPAPDGTPLLQALRLDRVRNDGKTLRIPITEVRESTGYFIFYAGREARPGEELMVDGRLRYNP